MKFSYYIILLFLIITFISCKTEVQETIRIAEKVVESNPDSAYNLLKKIENDYEQMNNKEKALFGVIYAKALLNSNKLLRPKDYIDFSLAYFQENKTDDYLAECYFFTSLFYIEKRAYSEADFFLMKAMELCSKNNDYLLGRIYAELGLVCSYRLETNFSLKYYNQAISHFVKAKKTEKLARTYKNMGLVYMYAENFQKSLQNYRHTLSLSKDSSLIGDVLQEIGFVHGWEARYDSALYYLHTSLKYPYISTNRSKRLYNIGYMYYKTEQYDSAEFYCNKALQEYSDIYLDRGCLQILLDIKIKEGNQDTILTYIGNYREIIETILNIERENNTSDIEKIYDLEQKKGEADVNQFRLTLLLTVVFLLSVIGISLFIRKHKHRKQKIEEYKNQLNNTKRESSAQIQHLHIEKKKKEYYKKELEEKQKNLIQKVDSELLLVKSKYDEEWKKADFKKREEINKHVFSEVLLLDSPNKFLEKMNKTLNNVPEKLKSEYPNISHNEILWCCLFLLGISTNNICLIMGYKSTSLYKFKQRLYKKLNFDNVKDFEQMLQNKLYWF